MRALISFYFLLALVLAGCSSTNVSTNYSHRVDFKSLKTYAWYSNEVNISKDSRKVLNAALDRHIRDEIESRLNDKGFTKSSDGNTDFLVNYVVSAQTRINLKTYHVYSGSTPNVVFTRGNRLQLVNQKVLDTEQNEYLEGTLLIDMIDPKSDKMMWRGVAEKRLTGDLDAAQRAAIASEAIRKVIGQFPPE